MILLGAVVLAARDPWKERYCRLSSQNGNDQLPDRRIGELLPEDQELAAVQADDPLDSATSTMLGKDYSQLPVVSNDGKPVGIITWKSIRKSPEGGVASKLVRDYMESSEEVAISRFDAPLVDPMENIAEYGYVLITEDDGTLKGIVTASDLANYFGKFARGFLAIEEIEAYLARLIDGKFNHDKKKKAGGRCDCGQVTLTLGQYPKLLKTPEHWDRVKLDICKRCFMSYLESVSGIRNGLMHFDARELKPEYLKKLHNFLILLRGLK